jgi:hypothetical protein
MEIQKGVPIPKKRGGSGRPSQFPWNDMQVGDCVTITEDEVDCTLRAVSLSAHNWAWRRGRKMATRQEDDKIYVWLVS